MLDLEPAVEKDVASRRVDRSGVRDGGEIREPTTRAGVPDQRPEVRVERAQRPAVALTEVACALVAVGVVVGGAVSAAQADDPPNHANRLEATFTETNASTTNRIADLGVFQLINTGTGTVEGFGSATLMLSATQDRSVHPCGPGSSTNAAIRRIVLADGVLVLRELVHVCPTSSGPLGTGTWQVDGASSTGIFAGAGGSGDVTIVIATGTATVSGKLNLVG